MPDHHFCNTNPILRDADAASLRHHESNISHTNPSHTQSPLRLTYLDPSRCIHCLMRSEVCICESIQKIENKHPLTIIMHSRESIKTTNTARLAHATLSNSRIFIHGRIDQPADFSELLLKDHTNVLLTLSDQSKTLSSEWISRIEKPIHLIVPDGNWRQANKMKSRIAEVKHIPWVKLPPGPPSNYQLRAEAHPEGLSTLEAIARAYHLFEGPEVSDALLRIFNTMVSRTLSTRPSHRHRHLD